MYRYEEQREQVFTEAGQRTFLRVRDNVSRLLRDGGAVRMQEAISVGTGDTWLMIACVDRLVELGELRELAQSGTVAGQHRVFVAA